MTLIDLGEPSRYDPGRPPPLQQLLRKLLAAGNAVRARRVAVVALLVVLTGALAGAGPGAEPLPTVHRVGRFVASPSVFASADVVLNAAPDGQTMIASALDGSGEKWRLSVGNAGPVRVVATARGVTVLAGGLMAVDGDAVFYWESVVAVDVRTGEVVWRRNEEPVFGATDLVVVRAKSGALSGVDVSTGRLVWRTELPVNAQVVPISEEGGRELVILRPDGTIEVVTTATGRVAATWRVSRPAKGLTLAWRDLVVLQSATERGSRIEVFRRGGSNPLWHLDFPTTEFFVYLCADHWFCVPDELVDPYTGAGGGKPVEQPAAEQPGHWDPLGEYAGHQLVTLDPRFTADSQLWLGVVRTANQVRPLMPLGGRANACILIGNWLYCDGSAVVDAVSVRLSDLDGLLAEVGGLA